MELSEFVGKPCQSRTAFQFTPKSKTSFDLTELARKLRESDVFVELESKHLLMLKFEGKNISLFKSGKIIIKQTKEETEAREIAEKLVQKFSKKINNIAKKLYGIAKFKEDAVKAIHKIRSEINTAD